MCPRQRKVRAAVIEIDILPAGGVMAGATIGTIGTAMFIILPMARITICGRAFELPVDMAGLTVHVRMLAFQLERGEIVIEFRGRPAVRRVTVRAAGTEAAPMRVSGTVTGITVLERRLEIRQTPGIPMALYASQASMPACDLEG